MRGFSDGKWQDFAYEIFARWMCCSSKKTRCGQQIDQPPIVQKPDPISKLHCKIKGVSDNDDTEVLGYPSKLVQCLKHLARRLRIERRRNFIEQQDLGTNYDSARQG